MQAMGVNGKIIKGTFFFQEGVAIGYIRFLETSSDVGGCSHPKKYLLSFHFETHAFICVYIFGGL